MFSRFKICSKSNTFSLLSRIQECHLNYKKKLSSTLECRNFKNIYTSAYLNFKLPGFQVDKSIVETEDEVIEIKVSEELGKLKDEIKQKLILHNKILEFRDQRHTMDLLFVFEKDSDLEKFMVSTDSSNDVGYSSASLKISPIGTAIFSGYLCTEIPKTGDVKKSGFVNMNSIRMYKSFKRLAYFDWTHYTHLVLKVRGDGRTYKIMLRSPGDYRINEYTSYNYPLHTRGGPYWQITKIPFSHFYFTNFGKIVQNQGWVMPLDKIARFGISLADNIDGPFKLEIDYIGLEHLEYCKKVSPYERYYVGRHRAS